MANAEVVQEERGALPKVGMRLLFGPRIQSEYSRFTPTTDEQGNPGFTLVEKSNTDFRAGGGIQPIIGEFKKVEINFGSLAKLEAEGDEPGASIGVFTVLGTAFDRTHTDLEEKKNSSINLNLGVGAIGFLGTNKKYASADIGAYKVMAGEPGNPDSAPGFVHVGIIGTGVLFQNKFSDESSQKSGSDLLAIQATLATAAATGPDKMALAGIIGPKGNLVYGVLAKNDEHGGLAAVLNLSAGVFTHSSRDYISGNGDRIQRTFKASIDAGFQFATSTGAIQFAGGVIDSYFE